MPIVWDASADRAFLLAIIKTNNVTVDYEAVSREMSTDDKPVTVSALQNRYKKLKKFAKEGTGGDGENPTATPAKRKNGANASTPSAKKARTTTKKGKSEAKEVESDGEDDAEESEGDGGIKDEPNFDD